MKTTLLILLTGRCVPVCAAPDVDMMLATAAKLDMAQNVFHKGQWGTFMCAAPHPPALMPLPYTPGGCMHPPVHTRGSHYGRPVDVYYYPV